MRVGTNIRVASCNVTSSTGAGRTTVLVRSATGSGPKVSHDSPTMITGSDWSAASVRITARDVYAVFGESAARMRRSGAAQRRSRTVATSYIVTRYPAA